MDGYPKRYIVLDPHQRSERSLILSADARIEPYPPNSGIERIGIVWTETLLTLSSLRSGIQRSP